MEIKERIEKIIILIGMLILVLFTKNKDVGTICFLSLMLSELGGWLYGRTNIQK